MKLILIGILGILMISLASAVDWDNKLTYSNNDLKVEFKNSILGVFPTDTIGTVELKSHQSADQVLHVTTGKEVVTMFYDFDFAEDYQNGLGSVEFIDMKTGKKIDRDYYLAKEEIVNVNDTKDIYNTEKLKNGTIITTTFSHQEIIGSHQEKKWIRLNSDDIPTGKTRIGLVVEVIDGDYIDGVWTIAGKKVSKHSTWTSDLLVGLYGYWTQNTRNATSNGAFNNVTQVYDMVLRTAGSGINLVAGLISNALNMTGDGNYEAVNTTVNINNSWSTNFWTRVDAFTQSCGASCHDIFNSANTDGGTNNGIVLRVFGNGSFHLIIAGASPITLAGNISAKNNTITMWTITSNSSGNYQVYINNSLAIKSYQPSHANFNAQYIMYPRPNVFGAAVWYDEIGLWNATELNSTQITALYNNSFGITYTVDTSPSVTLNAPANSTTVYTPSVTYNITGSDDVTLQNLSLIVDGVRVSTNTSPINNTLTSFPYSFTSSGFHNWSGEACDNIGQCIIASYFHIWYNNSLAATLNAPANAFNSSSANVIYNATGVDDTSLVNMSFILNGSYNGTNTSVYNNTLTQFARALPDGFYNWTVEVCDNSGVCLNATARNITIDTVTPLINFASPTETNGTYINRNYIISNVTVTDANILNISTNLYNGSFTLNSSITNTTSPAFNNFTGLADGRYYLNATTYDVTLHINSTETRDIIVDTTPPALAFVSPTATNNTTILDTYFFVNTTLTEVNPYNITFSLTNATSGSLINNTTYLTNNATNLSINFSSITYGQYKYNVTSVDLAGNSVTIERYFSSLPFSVGGESWNASAYETSAQTYFINITSATDIIFITSNLVYNGTAYRVNTTCSGGLCEINRTIDVPLTTGTNEYENKSFYWSLQTFTATATFNYTSTTNQQNVSRIHLEKSSATYPNQTVNFTTWDEINRTSISPMQMQVAFESWLGSGSVKRTSNYSSVNVSNVNFSIIPANFTHHVDGFIQYNDNSLTNGLPTGTYNTRDYHLENATFTNTSQNIRLFLLNSSLSTSFIQKVITDTQLVVTGALVMTQRYYPDTNSYETVQIYKTDDNGQTIGFFQTEIPDYRTIVVQDGEILLTTERGKVFPQTAPYTLIFTIGSTAESIWEQFEGIESLYSNLTFNKTTGIVTYQWIDTTGGLSIANLVIEKIVGNTTNSVIYNQTSILQAGALSFNVSNQTGQLIAKGYIGRSPAVLDQLITIVLDTLKDAISSPFLLLFWLILIAVMGMGLFNPAVGLILTSVVLLMGSVMGIVAIGWIFVWAIIAITVLYIILSNYIVRLEYET